MPSSVPPHPRGEPFGGLRRRRSFPLRRHDQCPLSGNCGKIRSGVNPEGAAEYQRRESGGRDGRSEAVARRNRGRNRGGEVGGMGFGCSLYSVMVRGRDMGYRYIVWGSVYFAYRRILKSFWRQRRNTMNVGLSRAPTATKIYPRKLLITHLLSILFLQCFPSITS